MIFTVLLSELFRKKFLLLHKLVAALADRLALQD